MQIVINIPNAPIKDYQDLYYKIHGMAASEGLFDDKEKSQRALALKAVLDILDGIVDGTSLPEGHGRLVDIDLLRDQVSHDEREAFSKHQVWLLLSVHNKKIPTIIEADKESEE